eukprot:3448150-Prymnesium_polylepis.1
MTALPRSAHRPPHRGDTGRSRRYRLWRALRPATSCHCESPLAEEHAHRCRPPTMCGGWPRRLRPRR